MARHTCTDFLVRSVVHTSPTRKSDTLDDTDSMSDEAFSFLCRGSGGRLLAGRQKTSFDEIGMNDHAHSVLFPRADFLNLGRLGNGGQHLGQGNRCL